MDPKSFLSNFWGPLHSFWHTLFCDSINPLKKESIFYFTTLTVEVVPSV